MVGRRIILALDCSAARARRDRLLPRLADGRQHDRDAGWTVGRFGFLKFGTLFGNLSFYFVSRVGSEKYQIYNSFIIVVLRNYIL